MGEIDESKCCWVLQPSIQGEVGGGSDVARSFLERACRIEKDLGDRRKAPGFAS